MTVETIRRDAENFPAGLRVLAVDDDPVCLKFLETLLRKCQYHVTTTNQARVALNMLRDNKDRFDVVISDVHMPDMDGFRLLELVGLEMDLPVIMLSANGDPKLVMKGITHGACDYLVKPVRVEELRNIWQHVVRRRKVDTENQHESSDQANAHMASDEGHGSPLTGNGNQNGKFNRKRKDEEDENEENGNECEDPATQKKRRFVWTIELHRKFVAAVNQLGYEKAVPKRILDLMDVDGLTRENVASHLQKYRLYLRRINTVATQQANMAATLRVNDPTFMHMGSLDGLRDYRTLSGLRPANVTLSPYMSGIMLSRLNSPANVNLLNLTPYTLDQLSQSQNSGNCITSPGQNPGLLQGIPSSLQLDQLQQSNGPTGTANFNTVDSLRMFRTAIGSPNSLLNGSRNNQVMLHGNAQQAISAGGFGNQSTHEMVSLDAESFNVSVSGASNLDQNTFELNSSIPTEPLLSQLPLNGSRDYNSPNGAYIQNHIGLSSSTGLPSFEASIEMQCQRQNCARSSQISADGMLPIVGPNNGTLNQKIHTIINGRSNEAASTFMKQNEKGKLGGFAPQGHDPLDELMNAVIKRVYDRGDVPRRSSCNVLEVLSGVCIYILVCVMLGAFLMKLDGSGVGFFFC